MSNFSLKLPLPGLSVNLIRKQFLIDLVGLDIIKRIGREKTFILTSFEMNSGEIWQAIYFSIKWIKLQINLGNLWEWNQIMITRLILN